jgi:hypothetical protein
MKVNEWIGNSYINKTFHDAIVRTEICKLNFDILIRNLLKYEVAVITRNKLRNINQ